MLGFDLRIEHLQSLTTGSCISPEIITERQYSSVNDPEILATLGFAAYQCRVPGLLMPIWGVEGNIVSHIYRPDSPRLDGSKKTIKYESPAGRPLRLDCHPSCRLSLVDPTVTLWVTEGIKKSDALASHGLCAIGLSGGVWGFRGKNEAGDKANLADWDGIPLNGREVRVVFDSDISANPSVMKAARALCDFLQSRGARANLVILPAGDKKVGVDDYFVAGGTVEGLHDMTVSPESVKGSKAEEIFIHKCYYDDGEHIYLEVRGKDGTYHFAYINEKDEISLVDSIPLGGNKKVVPIPLPKINGQVFELVGIPNEEVMTTGLMAPEQLFLSLKQHVSKYCDLAELDVNLCAFYILFTWFYPKVNTLGYLRFIGDTGKGKSRMQKVTGELCFYPLVSAGASSFSGMARQQNLWRGSSIIDEADFSGDKDQQLTKYINLGFEKDKYYILSDKQNPRNQDYFDPFGPKVFAMRLPFRDNATEGRLLSISTHQTRNADIPIILPPEYLDEVISLRNSLALFTMANWQQVDGSKLMNFNDIKIEPRLQQLAMPLSIVFQVWPEGAAIFVDYLLQRQAEVRRTRAESQEGHAVNIVLHIANGDVDLSGSSSYPECYQDGEIQAITPTMVAKEIKTTPKSATMTLSGLGFSSEMRTVIYQGKRTRHRAYCINNPETWKEITERYIEDQDEIEIPEVLRGVKYLDGVHGTVSSVPSVPEPVTAPVFGTDGTGGTLKRARDIENHSEEPWEPI